MPLPFDKPLDNESDKAYAAFCAYRDLAPHERSIDAAFMLIRYPKSTEKRVAGKNWYLWSADFSWIERARSYDAYSDKLFREAREHSIIRAQKEVLKHAIDAALDIIAAGKRLMNMPPVKVTKKSDDGREITYMPANASYIGQGAKMVLDGMKELRLCGGMAGSIDRRELTQREQTFEMVLSEVESGVISTEDAKTVIGDLLLEEFMSYGAKKGVLVDG